MSLAARVGHRRATMDRRSTRADQGALALHLWRHTHGRAAPTVAASLREIAEGTGLSRRGVQGALATLARRKLIGIERRSITDVPVYTVHRPWMR